MNERGPETKCSNPKGTSAESVVELINAVARAAAQGAVEAVIGHPTMAEVLARTKQPERAGLRVLVGGRPSAQRDSTG